MNKNMILSAVIVLVVGGVVGFYGGMKYQSGQRANFTANIRNGQMGAGSRGSFGGMVNGKIIAADASSITIAIDNGQTGQSGSRIVLFSLTTEISKFVSGTAHDFAVGTNVSVRGTQNQDGSLTAQSIQIRPAMPTPSATPQK